MVWILERISLLNFMTIKLSKRTNISLALLIFQISTNAMKPTRVTPTPSAPTHQVHMSATVPAVIREMALTVKVKCVKYIQFPKLLEK